MGGKAPGNSVPAAEMESQYIGNRVGLGPMGGRVKEEKRKTCVLVGAENTARGTWHTMNFLALRDNSSCH